MLGYPEARAIAERYVKNIRYSVEDDELVLLDDAMIERPYGWVFFYGSRKFCIEKICDTRYILAGNAPFLVERANGALHEFGTALPAARYIEAWERGTPPHLV